MPSNGSEELDLLNVIVRFWSPRHPRRKRFIRFHQLEGSAHFNLVSGQEENS